MKKRAIVLSFLFLACVFGPVSSMAAPPGEEPSSGHSVQVSATSSFPVDAEYVLLGSGSPKVWSEDPWQPTGYPALTSFSNSDYQWDAVATGDFDGDGRDEIALSFANDKRLRTYYLTITDGTAQWPQTPMWSYLYTSPHAWQMIGLATGDVDGDGKDEIVPISKLDDNQVHLEYVRGDTGGYVYSSTYDDGGESKSNTFGAEWKDVETGDFDGDGHAEVVYIREAGNLVFVWEPYPTSKKLFEESGFAYKFIDVETGDVDGDGRDEAVFIREEDNRLMVLDYTGSEWKWLPEFETALGKTWVDLGVGDLNGDGRDDIVLVAADMIMYIGVLAQGQMAPLAQGESLGPASATWKSVAVADVNGDGRDDLILLDSANKVTIKTLSQPDCQFPIETSYSATWDKVVAGNFDGNGFPALGSSPAGVSMVVQQGSAVSQSISIYNRGGSYEDGSDVISFTASAGSGAESWLSPTSFSGTASRSTPFQQTLVFTTSTLGTYSTAFTFTPVSATIKSPLTVTLVVASNVYEQYLPLVFKGYDPSTSCP